MKLSRRQAIGMSGRAAAAVSLARLGSRELVAAAQAPQQAQPEGLVETKLREIATLPLNPDGSAREFPPDQAGQISEPTQWRYTKGETPAIEFDSRKVRIRVETRGVATFGGTLTFADLEGLPRHSQVTLMQCASPNPRGIVKWTGVRFSDLAKKLGVQPFAHYCRFVASDLYWVEEDMKTMMHPQVMLAWMMNDQPIPPKHGAPLRLVIPFRFGGRSLKAITEMSFSSNVFAMPKLPPA